MKHRSIPAAALGAALLAFGCSDADQTAGPTAPDASIAQSAAAEQDSEKAALNELTRIVALALNDNGLRQRVKNDMQASRFTVEHKLPFSDYLQGNSGGILLAKMAKESGKSRDEIQALLAQVRPLEFYMPVPEQRETWTGGGDLWVGSLLNDHTAPTVYTLQGRQVTVGPEEVPSVPTLAIVPVETDFSQTLPAEYKNTSALDGSAIGTYSAMGPSYYMDSGSCGPTAILECDTGGSGGGGGGIDWGSLPTGMYLKKIEIPGDFEGPLKGGPEFETHLQAPNSNPAEAADLRCAGEHAPDPRSRYDQNGKLFTGAVLVADSFEMARFQATYGTTVGMSIVSWEDDDGACEIRVEKDRFVKMITAVSKAYPGVSAAIMMPNFPTIVKALPAAGIAAVAVASWLKSNDDLIGTRAERSCNYEDRSTGNFAIVDGNLDGTRIVGCSTLIANKRAP